MSIKGHTGFNCGPLCLLKLFEDASTQVGQKATKTINFDNKNGQVLALFRQAADFLLKRQDEHFKIVGNKESTYHYIQAFYKQSTTKCDEWMKLTLSEERLKGTGWLNAWVYLEECFCCQTSVNFAVKYRKSETNFSNSVTCCTCKTKSSKAFVVFQGYCCAIIHCPLDEACATLLNEAGNNKAKLELLSKAIHKHGFENINVQDNCNKEDNTT